MFQVPDKFYTVAQNGVVSQIGPPNSLQIKLKNTLKFMPIIIINPRTSMSNVVKKRKLNVMEPKTGQCPKLTHPKFSPN